jgi:hypothetical protein
VIEHFTPVRNISLCSTVTYRLRSYSTHQHPFAQTPQTSTSSLDAPTRHIHICEQSPNHAKLSHRSPSAMTPIHVRDIALKVSTKAFIHGVDALHRVAGVRDTSDEEPMPPLTRRFSEPTPVPWTGANDDLTTPLFDNAEAQSSILLAEQLFGWFEEESDRESELRSIRSNASDSSTWPPPLDAALLTMPLQAPTTNIYRRAHTAQPQSGVHSRQASIQSESDLSFEDLSFDEATTRPSRHLTDAPQSHSKQNALSPFHFPPAMHEQRSGIIREKPYSAPRSFLTYLWGCLTACFIGAMPCGGDRICCSRGRRCRTSIT